MRVFMKKTLMLLILLLVTFFSFGQIEKVANKLLLKGDFNQFLIFTKDYRLAKNPIWIEQLNVREVVKGFQEAMFKIVRSYSMYKGVSITCNMRLNVITEGNRIIYFYLESKEMKGFPKTFETTSDTTYRFTDKKGMIRLNSRFEFTYKAPLDESELFIDTIYLGNKCGHYGEEETPVQQKQIFEWVTRTDTVNLYKWLQSANTEKQVYAVKGFHYLTLKGVKISEEAKDLIGNIIQKKGTVNTCGTCDSRRAKIALVVKSLAF